MSFFDLITHNNRNKQLHKREYTSWVMMRQRCFNKNEKDYNQYGGRGITVCDNWLSFDNFLRDMGKRPEGMSIERKNVNKGYYKDNCIWASSKTQAMNRRSNHIVIYKGVSQPLMKLCEKLSINYSLVWNRLNLGWTIEKAIETKSKVNRGKKYLINKL